MAKAKLAYKNFSWTPELAYAIGLMVTDGNLSKDGRHFTMRSSDIDLLETFKKCLKIKNRIIKTTLNGYSGKPCYRVQFGNVQLYNWMLNIGLMPAKTHIIGAVKIPKKFFRDFLRGHLDGDGYIQTYKDTYNTYKNKRYVNTRVYTRFISASEKHIRWLYDMISKCAPAKGSLLFKKSFRKNHVHMWEIKFSKYDSLKLFRWIYYKKSVPALERKRKIAEKLLCQVVNNKLV